MNVVEELNKYFETNVETVYEMKKILREKYPPETQASLVMDFLCNLEFKDKVLSRYNLR